MLGDYAESYLYQIKEKNDASVDASQPVKEARLPTQVSGQLHRMRPI